MASRMPRIQQPHLSHQPQGHLKVCIYLHSCNSASTFLLVASYHSRAPCLGLKALTKCSLLQQHGTCRSNNQQQALQVGRVFSIALPGSRMRWPCRLRLLILRYHYMLHMSGSCQVAFSIRYAPNAICIQHSLISSVCRFIKHQDLLFSQDWH